MIALNERPDFLESGERARLIPVGPDSNKERKITSALVASIMSVEEFGKGVLEIIGAPVRKTSQISAFTEVVFKGAKNDKKSRPDGLIILKTGSKSWSALIEAKIGNNELKQDQVEEYLELAKKYKIDAVITISNQFSALPTHHPIKVNKSKTRSVGLYHWSWQFLIAEAILWAKHKGLSDPDQAYILEELIRYLQHDSSGVSAMVQMHSNWKEVCQAVQNDAPLAKTADNVQDAVGSWYQLCRDISLKMSIAVGTEVPIHMTRVHKEDPIKRLHDDCTAFTTSKTMIAEFNVPDAASRILLTADFRRKKLSASMYLKAPQDKATAKGRIGWITRQLNKCSDTSILIKAAWPSRGADTFATLEQLREEGADVLLNSNTKLAPVGFEVIYSKDLGARFKGQRTFVEEADRILPDFYEQAGQYLTAWVAPAPKMKTDNPGAVLKGENDAETTLSLAN